MHKIVWHTPSPLWRHALDDGLDRRRFHRPELLRFATDTFIEDLQQTLATDPDRLAEHVARPESWREPASGWFPGEAFDPDEVVKLYQPAHQRFYLISASLVCQVRGLPDRSVDAAQDETTSFVLRRLPLDAQDRPLKPGTAGYYEYGWFGPEEGWKKLDDPRELDLMEEVGGDGAAGAVLREERLPLFPMAVPRRQAAHPRRLLAGLVPVAKREVYEAAPREGAVPPAADPGDDALGDPRRPLFQTAVVDTLRTLHDRLVEDSLDVEEAKDVLAFALLDLVELLQDPAFAQAWAAVESGAWSGADTRQQTIFSQLNATISSSLRWREAVVDVYQKRDALLAGDRDVENGSRLRLDTLTSTQIRNGLNALVGSAPAAGIAETKAFIVAVNAVLTDSPPPPRNAIAGAPPAADATGAGAVYVIRCVHERPKCRLYGRSPIVSAPTQPFRLASFFDPDAPARPIRISMPVDTSISGLRRMPKNVSVLISDQLRKQMGRVKGISALEEGEVGDEPDWTLGMICSLSIPIITICALILLMIIVQLLNIVFWWLPFFKICFPIPLKK